MAKDIDSIVSRVDMPLSVPSDAVWGAVAHTINTDRTPLIHAVRQEQPPIPHLIHATAGDHHLPSNLYIKPFNSSHAAASEHLPVIPMTAEEQAVLQRDSQEINLREARHQWSARKVDGKPLSHREHLKGSDIDFELADDIYRSGSKPGDQSTQPQTSDNRSDQDANPTSTSLYKPHQTDKPIITGKPTGFEWAPGQSPNH